MLRRVFNDLCRWFAESKLDLCGKAVLGSNHAESLGELTAEQDMTCAVRCLGRERTLGLSKSASASAASEPFPTP